MKAAVMRIPDTICGRLSEGELAANFADAHPPLTHAQAVIEQSAVFIATMPLVCRLVLPALIFLNLSRL